MVVAFIRLRADECAAHAAPSAVSKYSEFQAAFSFFRIVIAMKFGPHCHYR
jgi:hypothetical protein